MNIVVLGINHKNTPIEIREKFYLTSLQQDLLLSELKCSPAIFEAFVLSTCNRTEVYAHVLSHAGGIEIIQKRIFTIKKLSCAPDLVKYFYHYTDQEAVTHLLKVATGLDSLVLGERQILGQVRQAVERAQTSGILSKAFNILTNIAIRAGKKAQNETSICQGGSSVSWAAIDKAEKLLGTLREKSVLVMGAGKMSELTVGQIHNKGFKKLFLMNRTQSCALALVEKYGGQAVGFCDIKEILGEVDIAICSTDAPHYILDKETVQRVMTLRQDRPLILIDISMPRNIDPAVNEVQKISLFSIDDLKEVVESSMKVREQAVAQVEAIIAAKVEEYYSKMSRSMALP